MYDYQKKIFKNFEKFFYKPSWNYPFYCNNSKKNDYLEEYFIEYFAQNQIKKDTFYIPVNWTSVYKLVSETNDWTSYDKLQLELNSLNPNYQYFTICTNDNAPLNILPSRTINFSAGTCCCDAAMKNALKDQRINIPIPLICKQIPKNLITIQEKIYTASFIGRNTHQIRKILKTKLSHLNKYYIQINNKNISDVDSLNYVEMMNFINLGSSSIFSFCPRGVVSASYRLYEVMQLNSIPIYISDTFWLPWEQEINWKSFCILVKDENIDCIPEILEKEIKDKNYINKLNVINKIYDKYFTLESVTKNILNMIK
jgi:hypothetical protein